MSSNRKRGDKIPLPYHYCDVGIGFHSMSLGLSGVFARGSMLLLFALEGQQDGMATERALLGILVGRFTRGVSN